MTPIESRHPPGLVAVTGGELARYHDFTMSFSNVLAPAGSAPVGAFGYDTQYNSNDALRIMFKEMPEAQWCWITDDDHAFPQETLIRLLDREVDVVVPLYSQRQPPFLPCAFKSRNKDGSCNIFQWQDFTGKSGLVPIASAGKSGILIRRHVAQKLGDPWFERVGKIGEDHAFFDRCQQAGFGTYVDLDVHFEHLTPVSLEPYCNDEGKWCTRMNVKRGQYVEFWPANYIEEETGDKGPGGLGTANAVQGECP